jgi:luciferase-like monooxygenase
MSGARISLSVPPQLPPADTPGYARRAESAGFDELWLAEDCFFADGVAAISAALSSTHRLVVGLGIMPAVARNAAFAAMEVAAVAELYPGRLIIGVGHAMARACEDQLLAAVGSVERFAADLPDRWIDQLVIAGDLTNCADRIASLVGQGIGHRSRHTRISRRHDLSPAGHGQPSAHRRRDRQPSVIGQTPSHLERYRCFAGLHRACLPAWSPSPARNALGGQTAQDRSHPDRRARTRVAPPNSPAETLPVMTGHPQDQ